MFKNLIKLFLSLSVFIYSFINMLPVNAADAQVESIYVPPVIIPAFTIFNLRLEETLYSKHDKDNYIFYLALKDDYKQNEMLVIPKGTLFIGKLNEVNKRGILNKGASLELNISQMRLVNGNEVAIATEIFQIGNRLLTNNKIEAQKDYTSGIKKDFHEGVNRVKTRTADTFDKTSKITPANYITSGVAGGVQLIMETAILPFVTVKNIFAKGKSLKIKRNTTVKVKTKYDVFIPPYEF